MSAVIPNCTHPVEAFAVSHTTQIEPGDTSCKYGPRVIGSAGGRSNTTVGVRVGIDVGTGMGVAVTLMIVV